jgi:hypothetical protein
MKLKKSLAFTKNDEAGMAVFSGPKGHILMVRDAKQGKWEQVEFTDDDGFAEKFLGLAE